MLYRHFVHSTVCLPFWAWIAPPLGQLGRIVLQYMTDGDNPNMRDGTDQDSAGGDGNDPTEEVAGGWSGEAVERIWPTTFGGFTKWWLVSSFKCFKCHKLSMVGDDWGCSCHVLELSSTGPGWQRLVYVMCQAGRKQLNRPGAIMSRTTSTRPRASKAVAMNFVHENL